MKNKIFAGHSALLLFCVFLQGPFLSFAGKTASPDETSFESWMGIFMEEVKVGHLHRFEERIRRKGKDLLKVVEESVVRVSRMGGNPVVLDSRQESVCRPDGRPLTSLFRVKMAQQTLDIKAEVGSREVAFFMDGRLVKTLPAAGRLYVSSPLKELAAQNRMRPGETARFKILDFFTQSLADCTLKVEKLEETLVRGRRMRLWRIHEQVDTAVPVSVEEWVDDEGCVWKAVSRTAMLITTSLRMSREEALRPVSETYDIAFSTIIHSNMNIPAPRYVRQAVIRLSGPPPDRILAFPFDDGSQEVLETSAGSITIQTSTVTMTERCSPLLPFDRKDLRPFLIPSVFSPSGDPRVRQKAGEVVGKEQNAWKAAQKIALWVRNNVTPTYDVGFASADEVLKNLKGDCSEFTVLTVALCRAAGIPARAALGVTYADGFFAYHMWPEIFAGRWVNLDPIWMVLDPESGSYVTDAVHIKFGRSRLDGGLFQEAARSTAEVIGNLEVQIVDYKSDR